MKFLGGVLYDPFDIYVQATKCDTLTIVTYSFSVRYLQLKLF